MLCCLFVFSVNSCVSWENIRNCYADVEVGKTTAWTVKGNCGGPDSIVRTENNTVIYSYSQANYDESIHENPEIIDFYFSFSGVLMRASMYHSDMPLPWTCSDPFGGASFDEVPIVK